MGTTTRGLYLYPILFEPSNLLPPGALPRSKVNGFVPHVNLRTV